MENHARQSQECVLDEEPDNSVRVNIGSRAAILQVTLTLLHHRQRDTNRGTTVSNTITESVDVACLMLASQAVLVTSSVLGDVLRMALGETLDGGLNGSHTTLAAHALGRVVGVGTSAVPVTLDRLRSKGRHNAKFLTKAVKQPTSNHDLVTSLQGTSGANLELPLTRHDLSIDARDDETSLNAGVQMSLSQGAAIDRLRTDTAVERTLGGGETTSRPAKDMAVVTKHGVLLLEAEQRSLSLDLVVDDGLELVTGVGLVGKALRVQDLAHDEHIVSTTDGIGAHIDRVQDAIRVVTLSLASGRAIEGPCREVLGVEAGDGLLDDLGL